MIKKIVLLSVVAAIITSCVKNSALNYKGGVVIGKENNRSTYSLDIRYKGVSGAKPSWALEDSSYYVETIHVHPYEYYQYEVGDTIK